MSIARPSTSAPLRADPPFAEIERAVSGLAGVSLTQAGSTALLDRFDRKYLLPVSAVAELLGSAEGYAALEVNGRRLGRYRTLYLDTPDLALYRAHHSGRLPRNKVRIRSYLDSGDRYLEVKRRTRGDRTEKVRVEVSGESVDLAGGLARASAAGLDPGVPAEALRAALSVDFTRLTLIDLEAAERVTVDVGMTLSRNGSVEGLPEIAVVEIKQEKSGPSRFRDLLRAHKFRSGGLSKYCLGIAVLEPAAKHNRFKAVLRHFERIAGRPLLREI
jgi:hypothetical protein